MSLSFSVNAWEQVKKTSYFFKRLHFHWIGNIFSQISSSKCYTQSQFAMGFSDTWMVPSPSHTLCDLSLKPKFILTDKSWFHCWHFKRPLGWKVRLLWFVVNFRKITKQGSSISPIKQVFPKVFPKPEQTTCTINATDQSGKTQFSGVFSRDFILLCLCFSELLPSL